VIIIGVNALQNDLMASSLEKETAIRCFALAASAWRRPIRPGECRPQETPKVTLASQYPQSEKGHRHKSDDLSLCARHGVIL